MFLDKEAIQKIGEYVLLSSDVCAGLIKERDALLNEKEALQKQAAQVSEKGTEEVCPFNELEIKKTVKNIHEAGMIKTSEINAVCEDMSKDPNIALGLLNKMAEREISRDTDNLGKVEAFSVKKSAPTKRESDKLFNQLYNL